MVWLDLQDVYGQGLYFDIRRVMRQRQGGRWQTTLSGICGNGVFELPVSVEPGGRGSVHLPEPHSYHSEAAQLLNAVDCDALEASLLAAARRHTAPKTTVHPWHDQRSFVAESAPQWRTSH